MKLIFLSLALFVGVALGQLTINTPANVVECEPTLLSWSGGTPPYFLSILPGNQPGAAALQNLGQQSGTSLTWSTNIAAGTSIGLTIRDSTGTTAESAPFTVNAGSSSACLTSTGSISSTSGASTPASSVSGASTSTTSSATTPATTTPATTPTATTPAASPATSKSSGSSSTTSASGAAKTGGASVNVANMGVAGIVGAAVMAILA